MRANQDIRETAQRNHVFQWQIANALGISETHLTRKLRRELPEEERKTILKIIGELAKGK